jgi:tetratricopeptide (TPR) repeat protein
MSGSTRVSSAHDRIRRQQLLVQAEGYLELGMAEHALAVLDRCDQLARLPEHGLFLKGQCLRELGRFREALDPLWQAAQSNPENISTWLALGWCYKRTGKLDRAIESLEEALSVEPNDALVHYNLACYWALAKNKRQALNYLARAFNLEEDYRSLVADESDFDPIRNDPAFQALVRVTV